MATRFLPSFVSIVWSQREDQVNYSLDFSNDTLAVSKLNVSICAVVGCDRALIDMAFHGQLVIISSDSAIIE